MSSSVAPRMVGETGACGSRLKDSPPHAQGLFEGLIPTSTAIIQVVESADCEDRPRLLLERTQGQLT